MMGKSKHQEIMMKIITIESMILMIDVIQTNQSISIEEEKRKC